MIILLLVAAVPLRRCDEFSVLPCCYCTIAPAAAASSYTYASNGFAKAAHAPEPRLGAVAAGES